MGADGCDRGAHGRAGRRRGPAGHGDGVLRARQGARDGARWARNHPPRDRRARLRHARAHHRSGQAALRTGETHDRPASGIPELREAAAPSDPQPRNTSPPSGSSWPPAPSPSCSSPSPRPANPGDEVIYPNPGFPIYESVIRWVGGAPVPIPLREERGFGFALADLEARLSEAHQARHPQLAAEPDRRRHPRRRPRARGRSHPRHAGLGAHRRGLRAASPTATRSPRSPASPGCSSAPSCSTASRRPTR